MVQRGVGHRGFGGRFVQRRGDVAEQRERIDHARQFVRLGIQFGVQAQGFFVLGDEQGIDMAPLLGHHGLRGALPVQQALHALAQLDAVVGLAHEPVGAGLEAAHDVAQVGQRGQQQHRHVRQRGIALERAAQRIAVHAGHGDVADDEVGRRGPRLLQGRQPIGGHAHAARWVLSQQPGKVLGLGRTVLGHENLAGASGRHGLVRRSHCVAGPRRARPPFWEQSVAGANACPAWVLASILANLSGY